MEDNFFYASDERSSIELIEQEFALSQARANVLRARRHYVLSPNMLTAVSTVVVALIILALLTAAIPDMR